MRELSAINEAKTEAKCKSFLEFHMNLAINILEKISLVYLSCIFSGKSRGPSILKHSFLQREFRDKSRNACIRWSTSRSTFRRESCSRGADVPLKRRCTDDECVDDDEPDSEEDEVDLFFNPERLKDSSSMAPPRGTLLAYEELWLTE